MILLHSDCLVFKMNNGESVPCSAETITVELLGDAAELIDPELVSHAAATVLYHFKADLGKTVVSVQEFSLALEKILRGFGLSIVSADHAPETPRVAEADLRLLACESGKGYELAFFPRLREELRRGLGREPQVLCFRGLRGCVKQLTGTRRWCGRCRRLSDQIVDYLRGCLNEERDGRPCGLMVS